MTFSLSVHFTSHTDTGRYLHTHPELQLEAVFIEAIAVISLAAYF